MLVRPDKFPPLIEMKVLADVIKGNQETTDRVLRAIYDMKPELFYELAARDMRQREATQQENIHDGDILNEVIKLAASLMTPEEEPVHRAPFLYFEARRRAYEMFAPYNIKTVEEKDND